MLLRLTNTTMTIPMNKEPSTASGISPAPSTIPMLMAQNRKAISIGSLMAERNLTMDKAPTIPRERTTLELMAIIIRVVIRVRDSRETPKLSEYMTPLKVFL